MNRGYMFKPEMLRFERYPDEFSRSGEKLIDEYKLIINDDGIEEVVPCGKIDWYAEIQSHADSVDIHKIIEHCTMTGDFSEINKAVGQYGDTVGMPKTYAEVLNLTINAKHEFEKLSPEVRQKFNNNINQFVMEFGTDEFHKKLGLVSEDGIQTRDGVVVESEVKNE